MFTYYTVMYMFMVDATVSLIEKVLKIEYPNLGH